MKQFCVVLVVVVVVVLFGLLLIVVLVVYVQDLVFVLVQKQFDKVQKKVVCKVVCVWYVLDLKVIGIGSGYWLINDQSNYLWNVVQQVFVMKVVLVVLVLGQ